MFDFSKLKALNFDTTNMAQVTKFDCDKVENLVGKGETAFLLF